MTRSDRAPLHHAFLIKGWLLGREVPFEVSAALDAVIEALSVPGPAAHLTPTSVMLAQAEAAARSLLSLAPPEQDGVLAVQPDATPAIAIGEKVTLAGLPEPLVIAGSVTAPDPNIKPKRNWSPEQREAAAERMRARQAAGLMKRPPAGEMTPDRVADDPPPVRPVTIDAPHRLTVEHPDSAGRRDPGQGLTDEDWPDIKARLARSPDRRAIAGDYDVEADDLNVFIQSCQRREQRAGEALAPRHHGA